MVLRVQSARCPRSRRPRLRLALATLAAAVGLSRLSGGLDFLGASAQLGSRSPGAARRAEGFSYGKPKGEAQGFNDADAAKPRKPSAGKKPKKPQTPKKSKKQPTPKSEKGGWRKPEANGGADDEETGDSTALAKDERAGKSSALSTTKLKDLRDKTLMLRQKREAELDEYEEGRAMIAKYGPEVGMMPKKVAKRAAKRGMVIGGSFYATMLAVFGIGIAIYKTQDLIIPPSLMAFVTLALLALAVFGGSYGLMSASWDEDKEGSVLGVEEFGSNVKAIGEGFRRMSMQNEYDKAVTQRNERKGLLKASEEKKKELLNK